MTDFTNEPSNDALFIVAGIHGSLPQNDGKGIWRIYDRLRGERDLRREQTEFKPLVEAQRHILAQTPLSNRTRNAVHRAYGAPDLIQPLDTLTDKQLLSIRNFGYKALAEWRSVFPTPVGTPTVAIPLRSDVPPVHLLGRDYSVSRYDPRKGFLETRCGADHWERRPATSVPANVTCGLCQRWLAQHPATTKEPAHA